LIRSRYRKGDAAWGGISECQSKYYDESDTIFANVINAQVAMESRTHRNEGEEEEVERNAVK
jgi:hypothetical protein